MRGRERKVRRLRDKKMSRKLLFVARRKKLFIYIVTHQNQESLHYTAYDLEKWKGFSRYTFNANVTQQDMMDTFQPPFRSCVEEGKASCLMCSYNQVNGVPACARRDLIDEARQDWGFQRYVTSDCGLVSIIYEEQKYAESPEDAVAVVLKAGMDINCGSYLLKHAESAVKLRKVSEKDIDRAVTNLFLVQLRPGLYNGDPRRQTHGNLGLGDVCSKKHREIALDAARQGFVLLKNDNGFLPLKRSQVASLALVGPAGNKTDLLGGGYSGVPCNIISIFDGLRDYVPMTPYAEGCPNTSCFVDRGFKEAVRIARMADVVVVAGLNLTEETEDHDRVSLLLSWKRKDLVDAVASVARRPMVLVLMGGGPLDISFARDDPRIGSIFWIGYPSEVGGQVLAEAIFGEFNPVVYGFGYGLSYTTCSYKFLSAPSEIRVLGVSNGKKKKLELTYGRVDEVDYLNIDENVSCKDLKFNAKIEISNDGDMDGSHPVLLFLRSEARFKGSPKRQLVGFDRVFAAACKAAEVVLTVDTCKDLSTVDEKGRRILLLGAHVLMLKDIEHVVFIRI
ncbi:putative beta-D-xylosidase 6 [Platanthera guangdongensis]|uniref:Beta-D-xylosidase 6 n=1 Tax=Platanthera guangdongensis TaxID=2320717 RepID=A0ABR2LYV0_9ASPA